MKPLTPQQQEAIAGAGEIFDNIDADFLPYPIDHGPLQIEPAPQAEHLPPDMKP